MSKKKKLADVMKQAVKDPLFMKDLNETMEAFEISDNEMLRGNEEW